MRHFPCGSLGVLQAPARLPIINQAHTGRLDGGAQDDIQTLVLMGKRSHATEHSGVFATRVIDDRAVELLTASSPLPPLEVTSALRAMVERLERIVA